MSEAVPAWLVLGKSLCLCERTKLRGHRSGLLLLCGPSAVSAKGTERVQGTESDGGNREITCGHCCWPGSPRDSREKRTEEEVRTSPGTTAR